MFKLLFLIAFVCCYSLVSLEDKQTSSTHCVSTELLTVSMEGNQPLPPTAQ